MLNANMKERLEASIQQKNVTGLLDVMKHVAVGYSIALDELGDAEQKVAQWVTKVESCREDLELVRQACLEVMPELITGTTPTETVAVGPDGGVHVVKL